MIYGYYKLYCRAPVAEHNAPRGLISEDEILAIRERNAQRLRIAKEQLGDHWICHPHNHVQRKTTR